MKCIWILMFLFSQAAWSLLESSNIIPCTSEHDLFLYNEQREQEKTQPSLKLAYDTAITALCIGKIKIGINSLSDSIKEYKVRNPKKNLEDREILQSMVINSIVHQQRQRQIHEKIQKQMLRTSSPGFFMRDKTLKLIPVIEDNATLKIHGFIIDSKTRSQP